jgi:hypothetical protein
LHHTCESALALDLASPATRRAINPNANSRGVLRWSIHGEEIAAIGYAWSHREAKLVLRYSCNGVPVEQTINVVRTVPHFGGVRLWFQCPATGQRVRLLYLPSGGRLWASRLAYGLTFQSQRDRGWERAVVMMMLRAGSPLLKRPGGADLAIAGLREERMWEKRETTRSHRNEVRRIARTQRMR